MKLMVKSKTANRSSRLERVLPYLLIIGGLIGLICSLILLYDQIRIWENPGYQPACSLNPVVSCGSVINSKQGDILGIPGPTWGLIAFPVLITVGAVQLAGARLARWFWRGLEVGAFLGVAFALWLFWLSLYRVHALCPFCLTVDTVVYTLFWYLSLYNLEAGNISLPAKLRPAAAFARRHHLDLLILWLVIVAAWILHHFWYYYGQHL